MFIDDLKKSILLDAIQGKLIEQNPNDEPITELLKKIQENKQQSIKDGKIKKGKTTSTITEEDKLFEIPSNRGLVKLRDIADILYGFPFDSGCFNTQGDGMPLIRIRDILPGKTNTYTTQTCSDEYIIHKGDMLVGMDGNFNVNFWGSEDAYLNQRSCKIKANPNFYNQKFLYYYLPFALDKIFETVSFVTVKHLSDKHLTSMVLPLPPLEEQKRIVAKLDELMPLLDEARPLEEEITKLEKDFPSKLRQSILQYAIQGKLVEQNSTDEPASELLKKIKEEKEKLIKEGKIKKEKPLEPITDEEKPFDIPSSWEWVRLGSLGTILGGKRIPAGRSLSKEDTGYKYIRVSDMKNYSVSMDNIQYVPEDIYPSISKYIINKEDVYITVAGTIGRVGKIPLELDGANLTENADRIVINKINQDWLIYCLSSEIVQSQISAATTQVGQPKLAIKRIQDLNIPLPPLEEQKRIVAKLDELLKLCDELEEQIG